MSTRHYPLERRPRTFKIRLDIRPRLGSSHTQDLKPGAKEAIERAAQRLRRTDLATVDATKPGLNFAQSKQGFEWVRKPEMTTSMSSPAALRRSMLSALKSQIDM